MLDIGCKMVFTLSMRVSILGLCRCGKPHYPIIRLSYTTVLTIYIISTTYRKVSEPLINSKRKK